MDLLPTFAEAGGGTSDARDGRSLVGTLRHPRRRPARALFYHYPHYHHGRPASTIIKGDWKLIQNLDDMSIELYDLRNDVGETTSLVSAEPKQASAMLNDLTSWREKVGARMPVPNPDYDPVRADQWWDAESRKRIESDKLREFFGPGSFSEALSEKMHAIEN